MNTAHPEGQITVVENFRTFARYVYAWPKENEEFKPGKKFYLQLLIVSLSVCYSPIGLMISIANNILDGHLSLILEDIITLNAICYCVVVWTSTAFKIPPMAELLLKFSNFYEKNKDQVTIRKSVKFYTRFIAQWTYYVVGVFTLQAILNMFLNIHCLKSSTAVPQAAYCKGLSRFYVPFADNENVWVVFLADVYQIVSTVILFLNAVPKVAAILIFVHFINLQLRQLANEFCEIFTHPEYPVEEKQEQLKQWIKKHNDIIQQFHSLNNYQRPCLFAHILFTGASVGIGEYMVIEQKQIIQIFTLLAYLGALGLSCVAGHLLTMESEKFLKRISFDILWYKEPICVQKYYKLITIRAQKSFVLEVGPFSTLSAAFFLSVVKSSYSLLVVLRNT